MGSRLLSASSRCVTILSVITIAGAFPVPKGPSPFLARQIEQARQSFEKGDNVAVIDIGRRVLEHAESAELRNILGKAYGRSGDPEKAVEELRSAIRLQPDNEGFHFDLGQFLLKSGDFAAATVAMEDAKRRFPRSAQIELALGVAYYCTVRYDDAVQAFLRTVELARDVPQPYVFLGKMLDHAPSHLSEIARECAVTERLSPANPYAPLLQPKCSLRKVRPVMKKGRGALQ
jgi:tetratricopeptide (TPR) repeat protein